MLALAIALVPAVAATQSVQAQTYREKVLYSFKGGADGANPYQGLTQDDEGNLYGAAYNGGAHSAGAVFRLSKTGKETLLYSFTGGADGANPGGELLADSAGNLYGITQFGGNEGNNGCYTGSCGVVFKLSKTGKETVLYSFCSQSGCTDGANPGGGLIQDADGNLYGTTTFGGVSGYGTVFKLTKTGKETVLYSFQGNPDGAKPYWGVIQDPQGNFYGTTTYGGINGADCSEYAPGCGTVFKLSKTGKETVLYSFRGGSDGGTPNGGVILGASGNLYGTAYYGGTCFACGVVFKLSRNGKETVLHSFDGRDGADPIGDLIQDASGRLYGATYGDQGVGYGTIFKLSKTGGTTVLYSFTGGADGAHPTGGVIQDAMGNLYGTTEYGGASGYGIVFKLTQ